MARKRAFVEPTTRLGQLKAALEWYKINDYIWVIESYMIVQVVVKRRWKAEVRNGWPKRVGLFQVYSTEHSFEVSAVLSGGVIDVFEWVAEQVEYRENEGSTGAQVDVEDLRDWHRSNVAMHDAVQQATLQSSEERARVADQVRNTLISTMLRPATVEDYDRWMKEFLAAGGTPSHSYGYNLPSEFYVARGAFDLPPLYGAQSMAVIVPADITVTQMSGPGHNTLFFMDHGTHAGSWVPTYNDTLRGH